MTDPKTHLVPIDGSGLTPCCSRPPTELPRTDRITADDSQVTCTANADAVARKLDADMERLAQERRERREAADAAAFASIPTYGVRDGGSTSQGVFIAPAAPGPGRIQPEAYDSGRLGTWQEHHDASRECPQPCVHLSQEDAREGRRCAQHPCICDDRPVRRGQGAYIVGYRDEADDTVVVSVWATQEDAERDRDTLRAEYHPATAFLELIVEGWHGRDRAVLS